jgi:hypothetical protein
LKCTTTAAAAAAATTTATTTTTTTNNNNFENISHLEENTNVALNLISKVFSRKLLRGEP